MKKIKRSKEKEGDWEEWDFKSRWPEKPSWMT